MSKDSVLKQSVTKYFAKSKKTSKIELGSPNSNLFHSSWVIRLKMPTFRNEMWVKCELSFAVRAKQPGVRTSERSPGSKAMKAYIISTLLV